MFNGYFEVPTTVRLEGAFSVRASNDRVVLFDDEGIEVLKREHIACRSMRGDTFTLKDVTIGIRFHWERKEDQTFEGNVWFLAAPDGTITAINEISVEDYLKSVISSEMSAEAPLELLKAHAITSRSWLLAMLQKQQEGKRIGTSSLQARDGVRNCPLV